MSFPNIIYGHYGMEKETTSSKKRRLGTKMVLPDGRTFFYGSTEKLSQQVKLLWVKLLHQVTSKT